MDDEKKWFMRLYGDKVNMGRIVASHFLNLVEMKRKLRDKEEKQIQQLKIHAYKTIREYDESLKRCYQSHHEPQIQIYTKYIQL